MSNGAKSAAKSNVSSKKSALNKDTPEEKHKRYIDGIKKTLLPLLLGVLSAVALFDLRADPAETLGLLVMFLAILVQKYIYPYLGVDPDGFGGKDWFYISFMTFAFWFVSWTILLNW